MKIRAMWLVMMALAVVAGGSAARAQGAPMVNPSYVAIRSMVLTGGTAAVSNLTLKRDRVTMTFTGTFHFAAPADGKVMGAVFVGQGTMRAETPAGRFDQENLKRLIGSDVAESDFKTAVLRWSDDTFDDIGTAATPGVAPEAATKLATEFETKFATETGANVAARLAQSVLNQETPGVFLAQYDGGRRGKFTYVLDHQGRIPVGYFRLNAGEKGLIFQHQSALYFNEVWTAFYAEADYAKNAVQFSDVFDVVDVTHYTLTVDLRQFDRRVGLSGRIAAVARAAGAKAVTFQIGESLSGADRERLDHQLRLTRVRLAGQDIAWAQEDWEGGFTVFLPTATTVGQQLALDVEFEGDFMDEQNVVPEVHYPRDNVTWLPRHGYLDRATFDLTFRHRTRDRMVSVGTRTPEALDPEDPQASITRFTMTEPVALVVFALGPFERKTQSVTWEAGGTPIPLEFNSVPSRVTAIKHEFILAELDNAVRYFAAMFGAYPYGTFGAAFHPYNFGQGFPTMLMIPPTDQENKYTHSFIAHETAHQWWGNIVSWRSYRDQWLSEGFAEYSGMLYAGRRDREGPKALADLIREHRESLRNQPRTVLGMGSGRLNDLGPITYGLRLNTTKTLGAYQTLVYNKGALVLRMLHFLFSHPSTYDDTAFNTMMQDFVTRHRNKAARTEDFWAVASEHFARTPTAQKFNLRNLDWFFRQWVYGTGLPSYQMEWEVITKADGLYLSGVVKQDAVDKDFVMILPLVLSFDGNQEARTTVAAAGPVTPFEMKVPAKPRKVELDPFAWVLSERTTSRAK